MCLDLQKGLHFAVRNIAVSSIFWMKYQYEYIIEDHIVVCPFAASVFGACSIHSFLFVRFLREEQFYFVVYRF